MNHAPVDKQLQEISAVFEQTKRVGRAHERGLRGNLNPKAQGLQMPSQRVVILVVVRGAVREHIGYGMLLYKRH